jgi:uncharacterized protein
VPLIGLLAFGSVVLLAMLLVHGYLWFRLVRGTTRPGKLRRRLTLLTVVLALLPSLAVMLRRTLPLDVAAPLNWVAYTWLGVAFYAVVALLALEPVRLVGNLWSRRREPTVIPSERRRAAQHDGGTAPDRAAVREDGDVLRRRLSSPGASPLPRARWRWPRRARGPTLPTLHPWSAACRSRWRGSIRRWTGCAS